MYGDHRLHVAVEISTMETLLQVYRDQACLPIMAMDQIRLEIQKR